MDVGPESKEFLWCAKLGTSAKTNQWEGRDDGVLEQLVLKRACLGKGAKDGERNLVEVTSFDYQQEKIEACICCLRGGGQEDVSLGDLTIFPPAIFKLVEGSGPIHLVGNHMMMDEGDDLSDDEQEDFSEEDVSEGDLSDMEDEKMVELKPKGTKGEPQKPGKASAKGDAKPKKQVKVEPEEDDEDDLDDEDIDDEDDDESMEEDVPEVKVEAKKTPNKKRKLTNGQAGDENKKPDNTPSQKKKKNSESTPTTPLQQKENKTPQSGKKTPGKVYESVDEVKAAIKKYPGGKPRKEDKFCNWVKSAFKVKNDEWIKELWKAHKKDLGI
uniref:Nucleoplasmin-like protein ANO39 n=1 Tax=Phallusia mammillata TaxID=59560 RepID=A0A6F9DLV9_9ASCI|nr:nucleoplasmin-like protein ANO39 [Phallusia mammillata]